MGLNGADAQRQIRHMVAFIEQEACEKVEEIEAKAEEEFTLEKGRLIQAGHSRIEEIFVKKEQQIEVHERIEIANMLNKARINILQLREEYILKIVKEAHNRLGRITKNRAEYSQVLEKLITQGLYLLMEDQVTIRCREVDVDIVKKSLGAVAKQYERILGMKLTITVDEKTFLPPETKGGVYLLAQGGRIKVPNTLEIRLQLIITRLLPEIRTALFGPNNNRKFSD